MVALISVLFCFNETSILLDHIAEVNCEASINILRTGLCKYLISMPFTAVYVYGTSGFDFRKSLDADRQMFGNQTSYFSICLSFNYR